MGDLNWDGINSAPGQTDEELVTREDENEDIFCPEVLKVWMPSSFGTEKCLKNGWGVLVEEELQLRISQANKFLSKIRLGLGGKAMLYRTSLRPANSQETSTRARKLVEQVTNTITNHARGYRQAHKAMISLGASESILKMFRPLLDSELKVSTDVLEENRYGQRNDQLAWFWRQGPNEANDNHPWMEERMCLNFN